MFIFLVANEYWLEVWRPTWDRKSYYLRVKSNDPKAKRAILDKQMCVFELDEQYISLEMIDKIWAGRNDQLRQFDFSPLFEGIKKFHDRSLDSSKFTVLELVESKEKMSNALDAMYLKRFSFLYDPEYLNKEKPEYYVKQEYQCKFYGYIGNSQTNPMTDFKYFAAGNGSSFEEVDESEYLPADILQEKEKYYKTICQGRIKNGKTECMYYVFGAKRDRVVL